MAETTTIESAMLDKVRELLAEVPEDQRQAAGSLLAEYGPRFFELAREDACQYLRRHRPAGRRGRLGRRADRHGGAAGGSVGCGTGGLHPCGDRQ